MSNNRKSIPLPSRTQDRLQQVADIPTTLLSPTPAPVASSTPTESGDENAYTDGSGNIPTLPFSSSGERQRYTALRHASARECARKAEEWRQVANYLKLEIAKLDEQLTELRSELTYAEVQAASYDQATRTLMRSQVPDTR